jgi:hypothetical protein
MKCKDLNKHIKKYWKTWAGIEIFISTKNHWRYAYNLQAVKGEEGEKFFFHYKFHAISSHLILSLRSAYNYQWETHNFIDQLHYTSMKAQFVSD